LPMQVPRVSASFRQGIKMVSSMGVSRVACVYGAGCVRCDGWKKMSDCMTTDSPAAVREYCRSRRS
jgi:hypothetical protein